jgi:hypothetical protein
MMGGWVCRKVTLLAIVALAVTLTAATVATGAPTQDPNCTFNSGKTTCVTKEESFYLEPHALYQTNRLDPCVESNPVTVYQDQRVNVTTTTTTVYKGKSDKVLSSDPVVEETRVPLEVTPSEQYYLCADGTRKPA